MRRRPKIHTTGRTASSSIQFALRATITGMSRTLLRAFQSIMLRASANIAASKASSVLITALGSENVSFRPS